MSELGKVTFWDKTPESRKQLHVGRGILEVMVQKCDISKLWKLPEHKKDGKPYEEALHVDGPRHWLLSSPTKNKSAGDMGAGWEGDIFAMLPVIADIIGVEKVAVNHYKK